MSDKEECYICKNEGAKNNMLIPIWTPFDKPLKYICDNCFKKEKYKCFKEQQKIINTHADKIRAMSDSELAIFIRMTRCCAEDEYCDCGHPICEGMDEGKCNGVSNNTDDEIFKWLQSEVKQK